MHARYTQRHNFPLPQVKSALAAVAKSDKISMEDVLGAAEYAKQQEEEAEEAQLRSDVAEREEQEKQVGSVFKLVTPL
jgi:hypothetical protein